MEKGWLFVKQYRIFLLISAFVGIGLIVFVRLLFRDDQPILVEESSFWVESNLSEESSTQADESIVWMVDVKGEVVHPGVYPVGETMRVRDALALAGGVTANANTKQINFAQYVQDEMVIYIPNQTESVATSTESGNTDQKQINLNQATATELATLPGIGEKKAALIIHYREENGAFQSIEDLLHISGIGEKTIGAFRELVTIE